MFGLRPDEYGARIGAEAGEIGAFGQESVSRVDSAASGLFRRRDDGFLVEVSTGAASGQCQCFVRDRGMQTRGIVGRVHGNRPQPEFTCRPGDANGYLAAIGNEQGIEMHGLPLKIHLAPAK